MTGRFVRTVWTGCGMYPFILSGRINSPIGECAILENLNTICAISIIAATDFKGVKQLKPIQTDETNITFVAEGCGDLPATKAYDENGATYIITAWEISPDELKKLQETGIIYLSVIGNGIPPVFLTADNPIIERTAEDGL